MYKLILVDDESFILDSIACAFEWEKYGFELAGTFLSAESAVEYMKNSPVDAIISDIKMPGMNGVQFASYVYNNYPDTIFVIISGYESFEYAKELLAYNVKNYLLKPISYDDMVSALRKIKDELDKMKKSTGFISSEMITSQEVISKFLIKKVNNVTAIKALIADYGIKSDIWNTPVSYICIEFINMKEFLLCHESYGREGLNNAVNNFMRYEHALLVPMNYFLDSNEYIVFFDGNTVKSETEILEDFKSAVKKNTWDFLKLKINISIKKKEKNIFDIVDIFDGDYEKSISLNAKKVFELAKSGESKQAIESYCQLKNSYDVTADDIWFFWLLFSKFIRSEKNFESFNEGFRRRVTEEISEVNDIEKVIDEFAKESMSFLIYSPIQLAKDYIKEHYREKISIYDVAKYVHISSSWFSKQFKSAMGVTFVDYLNNIRIEKAKELLKNTNLTINEIYEKVGYNSRNHFYELFRRYTGMSAHEYRKAHRNINLK